MFYILRNYQEGDWRDARDSLLMFEDGTFIKTIKQGTAQAGNPESTEESVAELFKKHILCRATTYEEIEFKALELMLTIGA